MIYTIDYSSNFKKQYKKIIKQGKNINELFAVIEVLSHGRKLEKNIKITDY